MASGRGLSLAAWRGNIYLNRGIPRMDNQRKWKEAAGRLDGLWHKGCQVDALPEDLRPATRAEGYAIQAMLEEMMASPLVAWKIAATSKAGQAHINVDGPLAGRIFQKRVLTSDTPLPLSGNNMRVAEPEFAFELGQDLPPRPDGYDIGFLRDAVQALYPAIELPASRFTDFCAVGAPSLIADNACANLFVFGTAFPDDLWRDRDLAAWEVTAEIAGKPVVHGIGRNVLGGPWTALHWLVNECSANGITLKEGQFVSTGTCAVPVPVKERDRLKVDFGNGHTLSVTFAG